MIHIPRFLFVGQGVAAALMMLALAWAVRRKESQSGRQRKLDRIALSLPAIGFVFQFLFLATDLFFDLDNWSRLAGSIWISSFLAAGVLSVIGVVFAVFANGRAFFLAALGSIAASMTFAVNLVVAANSVH